MSDRFIEVHTTVGKRDEALSLARSLVESKLAGCVQVVGPVTSIYTWKGKVEQDEEWLCLIKTTEAKLESLKEAIIRMHSYETPEVVALPIMSGSEGYLRWLAACVE